MEGRTSRLYKRFHLVPLHIEDMGDYEIVHYEGKQTGILMITDPEEQEQKECGDEGDN